MIRFTSTKHGAALSARSKILALVWALVIVGLAAWLVPRLQSGPVFNADLMALLPASEREPIVAQKSRLIEERFERQVALLIGADQFEDAQAAAVYVHDSLGEAQAFRSLQLRHDGDSVRRIGSFYFPLRFQLLTEQTRRHLQAGDWAAFERAVLARYFSPAAILNSDLIENDPLLLLPSFLEERAVQTAGPLTLRDGFLTGQADGKNYILLNGEIADSPFSFALQERVAPLLQRLKADLPGRFHGASLIMAGVLPHAIAGTSSAQGEISSFGLGATIGVALMLLVAFRSWRPLGLSLFSIAVGCFGGFMICLAAFGEVHLLTMVFGVSLVGIADDYSMHYFCERFRLGEKWSPQAALRHILPSLTLGLVTSVIGFAGLLFAPFPGIQQMAVFSIAGLCLAYGCVVFWYPFVTRRLDAPRNERLLKWLNAYARLWRRGERWPVWITLLALTVPGVIGCLRLVPQDDIRLFQAPNPAIMAEETRVRAIIDQNLGSQFFLVEGRDEAEALEREERLTGKLRERQRNGQLKGHLAISDFIASPARQSENRALLAPLFGGERDRLVRIAERVGIPEARLDAPVAAFAAVSREPPLGLHQWLTDSVSEPLRHLWLGESEGGVVTAVALKGVTDIAGLAALASRDEGIYFVDPIGDRSALFATYRHQTGWLALASYVVVAVLLLFRYGVVGGFAVMLPPTMAALLSFGVLGLLGEPLSLFNMMALLLVLGLGVDYSLFFRETGTRSPATLLGTALSSVTTLLAFGLLAFSSTAAIHAFGLTVLIGVTATFLLSPFAGLGKISNEREPKA